MQKYCFVLAVSLALTTQAWPQSASLPPGTSLDDGLKSTPAGSDKSVPLTKAEADIDAKNYAGARSLLDAYLSAHSTDARALFDRGYVEDAQGHADAAAGYYRKAISADPKQFEARLALGLILAREGKATAARGQLEAATKLSPNPPNPIAKAQAYRALAQLVRITDPDAAKQALLKALSMSPETVGDTLLTAEIAEAEGDSDTAEAAYRRVLNVQPESSPAIAGLAHLLIAQKKYTEAEPLLKTALLRDPDDPALNTELATVLSAEGKQTEAVAALEKLHQQQPNDMPVTRMLADAYAESGQMEKADPLYVQALKAAPNDPDLLTARGEELIRQKRNAEALPLLERAVKLKPDDADAWSSLAFAATQEHQYQLTLDALSMRSKYVPETPATYFLRATAYDNLHQTKLAAENYHEFLSVANGKFPDQEWQAKHRLITLGK